MLLDTHAHYDDEAFDADRDELLDSLKEHGIGKVINAGASVESSYTGLRLAERYPWVYAALGAHPNHVEELSNRVLSEDWSTTTRNRRGTYRKFGFAASWIWRRRPGFRSSFTPERQRRTHSMRCSAQRRAASAG